MAVVKDKRGIILDCRYTRLGDVVSFGVSMGKWHFEAGVSVLGFSVTILAWWIP